MNILEIKISIGFFILLLLPFVFMLLDKHYKEKQKLVEALNEKIRKSCETHEIFELCNERDNITNSCCYKFSLLET